MLFGYLSAFVALSLGSAQLTSGPKLPFPDPGACPFECCHYGEWTARSVQRARVTSRAGADTAFAVRPGEKVQAVTGVVITRRAGIVIVRKQRIFDNIVVPTGARLFVLHMQGEGYFLFWYKGATHSDALYAETVHKGTVSFPWDVLSVPQTEWWVKVKNRHGVAGWILNPRDFRGMDACGD